MNSTWIKVFLPLLTLGWLIRYLPFQKKTAGLNSFLKKSPSESNLLVVFVMPKPGRVFPYSEVLNAFLSEDLIHGDNGLFNRYYLVEGQQHTVFSVASLDTTQFELTQMSKGNCTGLVIFSYSQTPDQSLMSFNHMYATAGHLATMLGADLFNDHCDKLTDHQARMIRAKLLGLTQAT